MWDTVLIISGLKDSIYWVKFCVSCPINVICVEFFVRAELDLNAEFIW